ncbi:MAG: hypothetical protein QM811_25905 [Pirellulales bacterium]
MLRAMMFACLSFLALSAVAESARAADLSGCWEGCWQSTSTGHQGKLNADFERCGASHYRVTFRGTFFKVFPFRFSVVLNAVDHGDSVTLSGSHDLGRIFGTFTFRATATNCDFRANYFSCKDNGLFLLKRVDCCR